MLSQHEPDTGEGNTTLDNARLISRWKIHRIIEQLERAMQLFLLVCLLYKTFWGRASSHDSTRGR